MKVKSLLLLGPAFAMVTSCGSSQNNNANEPIVEQGIVEFETPSDSEDQLMNPPSPILC